MIAAIGTENLVIVDTPDALLVADRDKSQDVKLVVEALKASADTELTETAGHGFSALGHICNLKRKPAIKSNASLSPRRGKS